MTIAVIRETAMYWTARFPSTPPTIATIPADACARPFRRISSARRHSSKIGAMSRYRVSSRALIAVEVASDAFFAARACPAASVAPPPCPAAPPCPSSWQGAAAGAPQRLRQGAGAERSQAECEGDGAQGVTAMHGSPCG